MSVKSVIVNRINGSNHHTTVPCASVNAVLFADAFIDGHYSVYENGVSRLSNNDLNTCIEACVSCSDSTTGMKTSFRILLKSNVSENDLISVLMGKRINSLLVDSVDIFSFKNIDL